MADITMCADDDCPSRLTCWRYMAPANPLWQSYFAASPRVAEAEACSNYWPAAERIIAMSEARRNAASVRR